MIIFKNSMPRRTFLRGAGASVAVPFLSAMVPAMTAPGEHRGEPPETGRVSSTTRTASS